MSWGRCWVHAVLLVSGIGLATANSGTTVAATADIYPGDLVLPAVVLRGSSLGAVQFSAVAPGTPVVLRGSPLQPLQPSAQPACPPGYDYDPGDGCIAPGVAYAPDYEYWPSYGFDWFGFDGQRHRLRHGFSHRAGKGRAIHRGRHLANRFGHDFVHAAGIRSSLAVAGPLARTG